MINFSVVIPLYNKADTIERAVRSVAAQLYRNWELIIVNDGSIDNSLSVVRRLSKEIPMRIIDKRNGGVSSARNAGANVAAGEYIALLDGDDIWYPNHLKMLADTISKHPDVKFFGTGYELISSKYIYYTIPWGGCAVKDVFSAFRYGQPINTSTVAIERELWIKVGGFDEQYAFYEDYEFFFRLGLYTKCCVVRQITGKYMGDAIEQATKRPHKISWDTRPHLGFIESRIQSNAATSSMIAFSDTQLGLIFYEANLCGDKETVSLLFREFPCLMKKFVVRRGLGRALVLHIRSIIFMLNYKFRCHCVIWRKRA